MKICRVKKAFVGDGGELEHALDDVHGMLRKLIGEKNFAKVGKIFSDCRKRIRKQIRPSCRKTFRLFFGCLFGFVKVRKFRDSNKFSDCVQNVWANYYKNEKKLRKGLGTSLALQCSAGLVGSGFPCKVA